MFQSLAQRTFKAPFPFTQDSVTGKLDRLGMVEELANKIATCKISEECIFGLANIEQFKLINHSHGNAAGNFVLQEIAKRMQIELGNETIVGRMGNDEFGFISTYKNVEKIKLICENISKYFAERPLRWNDKNISFCLKFGIVLIENDAQDVDQILTSAAEAIYSAKYDRGITICEYDKDDTAILRRSGNLQHAATVDHWIARDLFLLYLQPIVCLSQTEKVNHFEVLIRGRSQDGGIVTPEKFISAAEDFNLTTKLDKWVIRNLFKWINKHKDSIASSNTFAVNISALSINDDELSDYIIDLVKKENINPKQISFEITERVSISNMKRCHEFMNRLRKIGFTFALDDFGTGYCSFKYIKTLPFDIIKIDGSFIQQIDSDKSSLAIVKAIAEISQAFDKKTVAESIENEKVAEIARDLGIDFGQGYLYSRPVPIDSLTKLN